MEEGSGVWTAFTVASHVSYYVSERSKNYLRLNKAWVLGEERSPKKTDSAGLLGFRLATFLSLFAQLLLYYGTVGLVQR